MRGDVRWLATRSSRSWFSGSVCGRGRVARPEATSLPASRMPPKAAVIPKQFEKFGRTRVDNYYWLKDRNDPKVIAYLEAENAYTDALMAHTKALQKRLYDEIVGRIKQADSTAPVFDNGYYYYTRFEAGKQYPILVRKKGSLESAEEILLDENALAEGQGYFSLGASQVSPDNRLLAFGIDTGGRLFYTIRIKDLSHRQVARRHHRRCHRRTWPGPTTAGRSSTRSRTRTPSAPIGSTAIASGTPAADDPGRLRRDG